MNTNQVNNRQKGFITALASAAALAVLSTAVVASAATTDNNFIGPSPGDYNTAGNWSLGYVPGTNSTDDNALINGSSVSLSSNLSVSAAPNLYSATVYGGGTLTLISGGSLATSPGATNWYDGWMIVGSNGTNGNSLGTASSGNLVVDSGGTLSARTLNFAGNSTLTMNGGSVTATGRTAIFGTTAGDTVTATLDGGTFNATAANIGTTIAVADGGAATITQSGATVLSNTGGYNTNYIGETTAGIWNLESGTLYDNSLVLGNDAGASGTLTVTGGAFSTSVEMFVGSAGNGTFTISGGTFSTPSTLPSGASFGYGDGIRKLDIGTGSGTGLFQVVGNAATISVTRWAQSTMTLLTLGANGTLEFDINAPTVSTITVAGAGNAANYQQNAALGGIIDLKLLSYIPEHGAVYNLLSAGTITDAGYSLAAADAGLWSLAITGTAGHGQLLQATYIGASPTIPEPAALGLLSVAGLGILLLGRRRRSQVIR